jgi:hypothetical protein
MSKKCVEIGTIQAFLDGELTPRETAQVSSHTADCADCSQLLSEAEEQNAFAFAALDREIDVLVPTQRLWTRISDSIEVEKSRVPIWARIYQAFTLQLATPSFAAAAGLLVVGSLAYAVITMEPAPTDLRSSQTVNMTARPVQSSEVAAAEPSVPKPSIQEEGPVTTSKGSVTQVSYSNHSPENLRKIVRNANLPQRNAPRAEYLNYEYLPGEESYIKTITELERTSLKNSGLRASEQFAFQRDLAVVDDSIKKLKAVIKKDPRNQSARQVLYSSYQDKIDLLNSAAKRDELMASLQ